MKIIASLLCFVLSVFGFVYSQSFHHSITWKDSAEAAFSGKQDLPGLFFEGCIPDEETGLPLFFTTFTLDGNFAHYNACIDLEEFEPLSDQETLCLPSGFLPGVHPELKSLELLQVRKNQVMCVTLLPFRKNADGNIEKLVSFRIVFSGISVSTPKALRTYKEKSVLAEGTWVKITTSREGVYKVTGQELIAAGLQIQGIHPSYIRMFGNGGAMLPEQNNLPRTDDLQELAIQVVSENPGVFKENDYILFFAPSPHDWKPVVLPGNMRFEYNPNPYSDVSCYFLTVSASTGKRIQSLVFLNEPPTHIVTTFHDYAVYKPDIVNLAGLGRQWFADRIFGGAAPFSLPAFNFPNIDSTYRVFVRSRFALSASETTRIRLYINDMEFLSPLVTRPNAYWVANATTMTSTFFSQQDVLLPSVEYLAGDPAAQAWVDYIEVNLKRHLVYTGGQFFFRDLASVGEASISKFMLTEPAEELKIWDISAFDNPLDVDFQVENDILIFNLPTPQLREFVAFLPSNVYHVSGIEPVQNQNLHGLEARDLIIVTPQAFLPEAREYARMRCESSDLSVLVVPVEQIYNEFSSGSLDPTAIRDFMKMLYDRAPAGEEPEFLLLFGDGSYDPKDRISDNRNFIPAFQSVESLKLDATYVSDDYYGLLDDGEGLAASGGLDIGIGRFPVNSLAEAAIFRQKVETYLSYNESPAGNWRNIVTMIAHDEDSDRHFLNAEEIAAYLESSHPVFTVEKIYLDAFNRVNIPGGYRYPDVNKAINKQVNDGALLINYIGHGGETGWAHSRVLTVPEINSWNNLLNMPVFITATCSFGRFDNPELLSAGEMVVLNPNGGGIALFTTSRLAYSTFNHNLNKSFTQFFFERANGEINAFGNVLLRAKNANGNNMYIRNFVLLGDPSLHPAIPGYLVHSVRAKSGDIQKSAISSDLTKISVNGFIKNQTNNIVSNFNGLLYPVVYDKPAVYITNANHSSSTPRPFSVRQSVIYKGKVTVTDGQFSFDFLIPKDVNPLLGAGKISYYATDGEVSAHGYFDDFLVGGFVPTGDDDTGPSMEMYLNTPSFRFGDFINDNPLLVALISDPGGVNAFGLGIGHDIVAFLDENTQNPILLNDYYEPDVDRYTGGTVRYHFQNLPEGRHTLRLKAYDLLNNASELCTEFVVTSELAILTGKLYNHPNPFSSETWFTFHHNYFDKPVHVTIDIFDLAGKVVKTIGPLETTSTGTMIEPLYWNGRGNQNQQPGSGVYPYRVTVQTKSGFSGLLYGKLMIMR